MAKQLNVYMQSSSETDTPSPSPSSTLIQSPTSPPPSWSWSSSWPSPQDSHPLYPCAMENRIAAIMDDVQLIVDNNGQEALSSLANDTTPRSPQNITLNLIDSPTLRSLYTPPPLPQYTLASIQKEIEMTTLTLGLRSQPPQDSHPLYPWAMAQPCKVRRFGYLLQNRITAIRGDIRCKNCKQEFEMELDLTKEFLEVGTFVERTKEDMRERAPLSWLKPELPICPSCHQDYCEPVVIDSQSDGYNINWLFLLLAQLLGCCTLQQLKLFCKTNEIHRTGAKDRLLYLTYLNLCKQLHPKGPFDR
ncbi:uncharacterized protein LOC133800340 [Humulus lupulus]|uniref:uncharacterized protein LOC133800340 n=1 Tax=Humulus lupulus TaxID=3486 RepID=UPI002B409CA6|nr:uncharacterized protein LOC133800340 [Humulus lupulus]